MTWLRRHLAMECFWSQPDRHLDVGSSEMREEIGLQFYLEPGDERMAPEELGRRIDECLVEYIYTYLQGLEGGTFRIEEFESAMRKIEKGMNEDPDLKAFEASLQERGELRLASESYLDLARRHVQLDEGPPASPEEGLRFTLVLLGDVEKEDNWQIDWDRQTFTECLADAWLDSRDPSELERLIPNSWESWIAWDILDMNCRKVTFAGVNLPREHLEWCVGAANDYPKRPDERPAPRHRPKVLSNMLRNNEIRHTVDLLVQVGTMKTHNYAAVANAVNLAPGTIRGIYGKSYSTFPDLMGDVLERLDPSFCLSPFETWLRLRPFFFRLIRK